jgi:glutamine amidotransferase
MCRWAAWIGKETYIEDVVSSPTQSLIEQSRNAMESKTNINADGFGVSWYNARPEPGLYKNILPAWADPNLRHLVHQVRAGLYMAHVRASTGTATSYNNCHPFVQDNWSFMHNGQVGGYENFRKCADMLLDDRLYAQRKGATDSELLFLLAVKSGLAQNPVVAMEHAVGQLQAMAEKKGTMPFMRLAVCWSDGHKIYAARYASDRFAPTVYWKKCEAGVLLVSEPLDSREADWNLLGPGQTMIATQTDVDIRPFTPVQP